MYQTTSLITVTINEDVPARATIDDVPMHILSSLRRVSEKVNPEKMKDGIFHYGEIEDIKIDQPPGHPDILAVTTTLSLVCGDDTSFYLLRREAGQWTVAASQEANNYEDERGAQGFFQYALSPPDSSGRWFAVTSNVPTHCISYWHILRYKAFEIGPQPPLPNYLFEGEESIWTLEDFGIISVEPSGFKIELWAYQGLDVGVMVRQNVLAYRVDGQNVMRVAPLAREPEGFLDEWFNLPWSEAQKWVVPVGHDDFSRWHKIIHSGYSESGTKFYTEFTFGPPACEVQKDEWLIGLEFFPDSDSEALQSGLPQYMYFTVALRNGSYVLAGASEHVSPKCIKGND